MRIIQMVLSLDIGGQERLVARIVRALYARGHDVHVVTLSEGRALASELGKVPIHQVHFRGANMERFGFDPLLHGRLYQLFKKIRPDVIHTHNTAPLAYAAPAARLAKIRKVVHTKHGNFKYSPRALSIVRFATRFVSDFVAVSDETARAAEKNERPRAKALHVIENGIPLDKFTRDHVARIAVRDELSIPHEAVVVGTVGRLVVEKDDTTKQALALGLMTGDPDEALTTTYLLDRAESSAGDSPLAAFAYARRADEKVTAKIALLLGSKDAVIRAHTARGLADAPLPDATGRLADAYEYESDVDVRRAIITALAQRKADASSPSRKKTLEVAAQFDPDGPTQRAAKRALAGSTEPFAEPQTTEVGWYRLAAAGGGAPNEPYAGAIVRSDGIALPIVFDDDGFAVVPGLPAGDARLVLTPRLPRTP